MKNDLLNKKRYPSRMLRKTYPEAIYRDSDSVVVAGTIDENEKLYVLVEDKERFYPNVTAGSLPKIGKKKYRGFN